MPLQIGIISDTHGILRPEAVRALRSTDMIFHAGDIGGFLLEELRSVAPVVAVRGNMDSGRWAKGLKQSEIVEKKGNLFYLIHDLYRIGLDPSVSGIAAVISGHTHVPLIYREKGVLYINPGSAGPRRASVPVSVALLHIKGKSLKAEIIRLDV